MIVLTSYDVSSAPGRDTIPIGQTKIEVVFSERGQGMGLEAMAGNARTEVAAAGGGVLWEQRWELADGVPAIRLQVMGPFGQVAGLYTVIGGRSLRMMGYGDLTRFDEIARTLRAYQ
ncbi:MAG: hypothetical protein M5R40_13640 [Anaerolineae bacterium]|nr:hypothetical protein [Anaerolineae bacterium]